MREDILEILQQYKAEILKGHEEFVAPDWWHYLDDIAINVHDWEESGRVVVAIYDYYEDSGPVDLLDSYDFTVEEFKSL